MCFNFSSNLSIKRGVVKTLMHRTETVVSNKKEREHELDHIRGSVKVNGNPDWRRVMRKSERLNRLLRKRMYNTTGTAQEDSLSPPRRQGEVGLVYKIT